MVDQHHYLRLRTIALALRARLRGTKVASRLLLTAHPPLLSCTAVQNGPDKRKREWFFLWFLSFIRICKNDTDACCPITVGPKRNLGRYALIEGLQLPSSAEEGTADAPSVGWGGAGQEIKFCSISGRTSPTRQRPVGSQSAKLQVPLLRRSSLRMKSDSRAFSVKCPTPSKSTATKFLLHNLRSCRHPCNAASAGVHPDRSCLRFFSAADYVFAAEVFVFAPYFIYCPTPPESAPLFMLPPYRARAPRRRLCPPQRRRAADA